MIEYKINKRNKMATLILQGELQITDANEIKAAFFEAINNAKKIEVQLKNIKEIHLTVIQLLFSFQKSTLSKNIQFAIEGIKSINVKKAIETAGCSHLAFF